MESGQRLAGRTALVTGGGSGIGRAACERFASEGATVIVCDIDGDAAARVAAGIESAGGRAVPSAADVSRRDDLRAARDLALQRTDRLDIMYANAGIDGAGTAMETDEAAWARVIDVNLTGVWHSIAVALEAMVAAGSGSIITQSSTAGLVGVKGIAAYSAAKGGVIALTRQVAVDYGESGIRANAICPGTVWTPLVSRTYEQRGGAARFGSEEEMARAAARAYPLGRLGTVDDVAALALFLASDESSWLTGGVFPADGGYTAR
jgi:NAD(P)-dependent dehydrogenase (short-subunit alcohol dehydrogenase family)